MLFQLFNVYAQNLSDETQGCIDECDARDVNCIAKCVGVPFPSEPLANETTACLDSCSDDLACRAQCETAFIQSAEEANDDEDDDDEDDDEEVDNESTSVSEDDSDDDSEDSNQSSASMLSVVTGAWVFIQ